MMDPMIEVGDARVFLGDCRDVLKTLPDNSVDSIVTDPPYELGFMGKKWDSSGIAYDVTVWEECLRVLKPGGHVLAFGGSRTWHRLAVAVEDAGFELRDSIAWIYGSGFPKSLDVSKAIDKRAGADREIVGLKDNWKKQAGDVERQKRGESTVTNQSNRAKAPEFYKTDAAAGFNNPIAGIQVTAPATPEAEKWQGWGTALKPAFEPVVVGRKPLVGTVAENVLAWGVGGLNIDGSRIGSENRTFTSRLTANRNLNDDGWGKIGETAEPTTVQGRWPANVILDEVSAGLLDEQSGATKSANGGGIRKTALGRMNDDGWQPKETEMPGYGDSGGASRFFYVAKASKRDRNEGLEELPDTHPSAVTGRKVGSAGAQNGGYAGMTETPRKNIHPTVKPTQLMRYLIKLVTPEGGVVLDPFTGSGSTGKAALLDGYEFVGAELTEEYLPIIEGRLRWAVENREAPEETLF